MVDIACTATTTYNKLTTKWMSAMREKKVYFLIHLENLVIASDVNNSLESYAN
jgi:hypothetical protein